MKIEFVSAEPPPTPRFALWDLGFRPFYLLASIFAAISIPLWVCQYAGFWPTAYVRSMVWHGNEMLFGYTVAVIAGFLFTAVRNWTGQPTPTGRVLAAYALLWVAGRVLVQTPFEVTAALVSAAFPVAVAIGIAIPMLRSGNRRNYFFVLLLLLLGAAALSLHLSRMGVFAWPELLSVQVGLDLVLFIITAISGRVLPMFTNNGVPGANATSKPLLEKLALGSVLLLLAADLSQAPAAAIAVVAALAACAHAARLALWRPWRVLRAPLVWILHAAYGWIVVYLLLRALAAWGLVAETLAIHALTIGAIGGMTIGMMTRTARGHTGRILKADGFEFACFTLIQLAAVSRVLGGLFLTNLYMATVVFSGLCWSLAFATYAVRYWPILSMSRLDGKPG